MKKTIKNTIAILFTFICITNSYSQKIPVANPSPEAASLGIVGNIPVSLHTGRADISIPLMKLTCNNYTLPVSLTYNSSGVMPDIRPTWVGQNWNLDIEGVITRVVKGLPDETPEKGLYDRLRNNKGDLYIDAFDSDGKLNAIRVNYFISDNYSIGSGTKDMEADEFHFNVNGISGKFYLGEDRKFHVVSNPGIKVEFVDVYMEDFASGSFVMTFRDFKITTADGTVYYLGNDYNGGAAYLEASRTYKDPSNPFASAYASSWLLTKIELPDSKETITFTYSSQYINTNVSWTYKSIAGQWSAAPLGFIFGNGRVGSNCWSIGTSFYYSDIYHRYLQSIEGPNFKLNFHISKANDLISSSLYSSSNNWQKLDSIVLRNKSNERVKSFGFEYRVDPRLFLNSVKEKGMPAGYQFEYNRTWNYSLTYGTRTIDHWGYFNNYPGLNAMGLSAESYYPPVSATLYDNNEEYFTLNREPNPETVTAGILKKIIYPTMGSVEFEYEANDYSRYYYAAENYGNINIYFKDSIRRWSGFKESQGRTITLQNITNLWLKFLGSSDSNTYEFMLAPGTYPMDYFWRETGHIVPTEDIEAFDSYQTYSIKFAWKELVRSDNAYGGGARIRKITHVDGYKRTAREYRYVKNFSINHTDTTSSGILGTLPLYNYSIKQNNPDLTANYDLACSQSFVESSLTDGSPVGYSEVTEIIKDGQDNVLGYTTYKYSNFDTNPDAGPTNALTVIARDFFARRKNDVERGKLLSQQEYSSNGTLVKQTDYTYQRFTRGNDIRGIKCEGLLSDCNMDKRLLAYTVSAYLIYDKSYLPDSKTETIRDPNGQNPVTTQTNYVYDSYNQIKRTEFTTSDNSVRKQEMKYPADFTNAPYPAMVAKHILSPVVETSVYRNTDLIEKTAGDYVLQYNSFYAPVNAKYQKGNGSMEIRATYQYDSKGNIKEEVKNSANNTVYLWGYNYQYPIAKIENATYSQVQEILTSALVTRVASANTPAANDLTTIKSLQVSANLSKALVTVYEYKPLVGISKMTDPRGVVTDYVYDGFGRLIQVLVDGKKEKDYLYHYKE